MAVPNSVFKTINIKPAALLLDSRTTPDEVALTGYRLISNWEVLQKSKMCRASGSKRLMDSLYNNNADLHDQIEGSMTQPITFVWSFKQAIGLDKLFAGTQDKLYAFNASTGNWRIIADSVGGPETTQCPERTWWGAGYGDVVVFTNNYDLPLFHVIDQPFEANGQAALPIPDLALLKVTKVGFVVQWNGLTFYCNVVEDGVRKSYRIIWSDYQNPISIKPKASTSLAGFKDLDFGEVVLNAKELGNSLIFYTNKGIWQCNQAGGTAVLSFTQWYAADEPGDRTLAYPRTLVSTGSDHYYFGNDGIYLFNLYAPQPQRVDWIHRGSSLIFDDINSARCLGHVAGFETTKKQLKFSWAKSNQTCPQQTLVINTEFPFVSLQDQGATCYGHFGAAKVYSLRQFILDQCICTPAQLDAAGYGFVKEGGFYAGCDQESAPACPTSPTCFWTNTGMDLDGLSVEDFSQAQDPNSLCARLAGLTVGDLCDAEFSADQCKVADAFIFADSLDNCLKETDPTVFYRQRLQDGSGCGTYRLDGYRSPLRSGPLDFGLPDGPAKTLTRISVEAYPALQTIPSLLTLRVGVATQALDPNADPSGNCFISWQDQDPVKLACEADLTIDQAGADNVFPDEDFGWTLFLKGRNVYFEFDVVNPNSGDRGGSVCLSRISMRVAASSS